MMNIYLNLAVCYMNLKHFSLALQAIKDAENLGPEKISFIYLRKSQV